jgi:hypothetical protein
MKRILLFLFLVSNFSFFVSLAPARVLHVEQSGLGDYTTIQASFDACVDGDTILIGAGVFPEGVNLSGKANVVVSGAGIGPSGQETSLYALNVVNCSHCEFWSMRCGSHVNSSTPCGLNVSGCSEVIFRRCFFYAFFYNHDCAEVVLSENVRFESDYFYRDNGSTYDGLQLHDGTGVVTGCMFYRYREGVDIRFENTLAGTFWAVTNCLFRHQYTFGSALSASGTGELELRNSIFWNVSSIGTLDPVFHRLSYNAWNQALPGEHNVLLTESPFVNVDGGDYHLNATSPCWDAGDPFIHDRFAQGHDSSISDMGCYGGMSPFFDNGLSPFPVVTSVSVTPVVGVGDSIQIQSSARTAPRY